MEIQVAKPFVSPMQDRLGDLALWDDMWCGVQRDTPHSWTPNSSPTANSPPTEPLAPR